MAVQKNGMFIVVPDCLKNYVTDVSPNNMRLQAIIMHTVNKNIMIISSYFPNNPNTVAFNEAPLQEILLDITNLLKK